MQCKKAALFFWLSSALVPWESKIIDFSPDLVDLSANFTKQQNRSSSHLCGFYVLRKLIIC